MFPLKLISLPFKWKQVYRERENTHRFPMLENGPLVPLTLPCGQKSKYFFFLRTSFLVQLFQAEPTCRSHIPVLLLRVICVRGGEGGLGGRSLVYPFHGQPANNPHCVASSPPLSRVPFDHSSGKLGLQACTQLPTALAEALGRAWPNGTLMNSRPVELARRRSWAQAMKGGEKKKQKTGPLSRRLTQGLLRQTSRYLENYV